jgi:hypothetical protein
MSAAHPIPEVRTRADVIEAWVDYMLSSNICIPADAVVNKLMCA